VIRVARPEDAPALARLLEAFNGPVVSSEQALSRLRAIEGLETVFLAEIDGTPAGLASVRIVPFLSDDVPYAELTELYVEPDYRRRGVGRALMTWVEALARQRGAPELFLLTGRKNLGAQAFYRTLGFAEDSLSMRKPL
jgi:GNAT superfamily N-acetyltransferase